MARIDKYDPIDGGFRAALAGDQSALADGTLRAVGLDANGRVVLGAGNSGIVGLVAFVGADMKQQGAIVDVMTDGEILEIDDLAFAAGTVVFGVDATGVLNTAGGAGTVRVGHTVEADRLVVRAAR